MCDMTISKKNVRVLWLFCALACATTRNSTACWVSRKKVDVVEENGTDKEQRTGEFRFQVPGPA